MLNLQLDHRKAWAKLIGQRKRFRGTIERFGHKHRQGTQIKKGATLVLTDVHQLHSQNVIDHVWVNYTPNLAVFGEAIRPHGIIEFEATVMAYTKGGKNATQFDVDTFDDLGLIDLTHIKIIKQPYWSKKYDALMGDQLVGQAIRSHWNVKSGLKLGTDPWGQLGTIYVGQGFANHLARTLSWKWSSVLPKKYR